jgi:hypothetical protein
LDIILFSGRDKRWFASFRLRGGARAGLTAQKFLGGLFRNVGAALLFRLLLIAAMIRKSFTNTSLIFVL